MRSIFFGIFLPAFLVLPSCFGQTTAPPIRAEIANAASASNIRDKGSQPFKLVAEFDAAGNIEFTGHGQYEENWIDAEHWQRKVDFGSYHAIETQDGAQHKLSATSDYEPKRILKLVQELQFQPQLYINEKDQWKVSESSHDLLLYELSFYNFPNIPSIESLMFEKSTNRLVEQDTSAFSTKYLNYAEFSGHFVPFEIQEFTAAGLLSLHAKILKLEPLTNKELDSVIVNAGLKDADTSLLTPRLQSDGFTPPKIKKAPDARFSQAERRAKSNVLALVDLALDQKGVIHEAEIVNNVAPDFGKTALDTVAKYKMQAARQGNSPVETNVGIQMNFRIK